MKVKDLIAGSQWNPGSGYGSTPEVSVLLPTYRRGRDGMLRQAAESVLKQSLASLELIIVDDGSTDGSAAVIAELMASDGRVSCIRHPDNIGLPAISEFEAYERSSGAYVAFAFDDFVFEPDALERLIGFMRARGCGAAHGQALLTDQGGREIVLGAVDKSRDRLRFANFIANGAVCLTRSTIETVGLYDPHVVLTRVCDWDLWRRIEAGHRFEAAPILMGREYGASRADSLENSYPLNYGVLQDIMALPRDDLLQPGRYRDRDIFALPSDAPFSLRSAAREMADFYKAKSWFRPDRAHAQAGPDPTPRRTVAVVAQMTDSVQHHWTGDPGTEADHVAFVQPDGPVGLAVQILARSDLVVFVNGLLDPGHGRLLAFCRKLDVPHAFFMDEDPLEGSGADTEPSLSLDELRLHLRSFRSVIVPRGRLTLMATAERLHDRCLAIGPILKRRLLDKLASVGGASQENRPTIAYLGDKAGIDALLRGSTALQGPNPVRLVTRPLGPLVLPPGVEHVVCDDRAGFAEFLAGVRRCRPSVLAVGGSREVGDDELLAALYVGAVPVLLGGTPEPAGVERLSSATGERAAAFPSRADDGGSAKLSDLLESLRERCDGRDQAEVARTILADEAPLDGHVLESRYRRALLFIQSLPSAGPSGTVAAAYEHQNDLTALQPSRASINEECAPSRGEAGLQSSFDEVENGTIIRGWANDPTSPHPCRLALTIDGRQVGFFRSDLFRPDLERAGIGGGYRSFRVPAPAAFCDGEHHEVAISFDGTGVGLAGSPKRVRLHRGVDGEGRRARPVIRHDGADGAVPGPDGRSTAALQPALAETVGAALAPAGDVTAVGRRPGLFAFIPRSWKAGGRP